jgi:hypothetical protein
VGLVGAAVGAALLLAACSGGSGPARGTGGAGARAGRAAPPTTSTPATWAPGVTAAEAGAGTATDEGGIAPWLAPVGAPAPSAPRSRGCAALGDPGWRPGCVRVDTGRAMLTGVVESRSSGAGPVVWRVAVWREQGGQEVETLAAGNPATPLWAWAQVRSAELGGDRHDQLVFGFENEGTGGVLDLDVVGGDGSALLGSQIAVYKGAATVTGGRILTYHPVYRANDPNCCPTGGADRDTLRLEGGRWVVVGSAPFALPGRRGFPDDFGPPRLR